ncbi:hypothetical protein [Sphingomonas sanxanigenens]|uniref:Lipoprotein n=1 Tax=Sphingomonas sanxanigenens DSM 19645 = NX02 TaxID=1123269 RepID=W0AGZ5_9SPHN|nr:hypothetical protein [Sphingomonas sanxanigenens]AHE55543.1 hypothetical protein NX02_19415 [Sphingomonas sanxanigenens DSM 19645 = NX02]
MHRSICLLAVMLSGCAVTASDLRARAPIASLSSTKAVNEIAACVADQWSKQNGAVASTPRPNGTSVTLTMQDFNVLTMYAADIEDRGSERALTAYAAKGARFKKVSDDLQLCV